MYWLTSILDTLAWPALALLVVWLLTMVSTPTLRRFGGSSGEAFSIIGAVLLQAAVVITIVLPFWGAARTVKVVGTVLVLGWIAEYIGSHTGFPFGRYTYTAKLQPQLGNVPVLIPVAWLMMLPPAWAIGEAIAGASHGPLFILASAVAFTAWDLFLDPQMVDWGLWTWHTGETADRARRATYFGVPWTNYAGWLGVSALITWVCQPGAADAPSPRSALALIYLLTWILEAFGQLVFWRLTWPAVSGAVGMGLCLLLAALRTGA
jgi:uncharacterized membrane protein